MRLRGLYLITEDLRAGPETLVDIVEPALRAGAPLLQYRDKSGDTERRLAEAQALRALCTRYGTLLLINDDVDLAMQVDADGVHLGATDTGVELARSLLGEDRLIGVSCYDQLPLARLAARQGADYIAFGSFFGSPTKPAAVKADPELLRMARCELQTPMVAIGGIRPENGGRLVAAGADMLAVISGVFRSPDIATAVRDFAACFD